jgi:hypothetical protein
MRPSGEWFTVALRVITVTLFVHWIVAGLDHGRFHWTDTVPVWLQAVALAVIAAAYALALWAMTVNRFFSSVARIQTDRGRAASAQREL